MIKKTEKVSIIVPAYNSELYIEDCINSVLSQTYDNWEMIIVNDCSTDNTGQIIETYCLKDNRIKLYNQSENKGVTEARNKAIKLSKGRFVAFLDSDDLWKSTKLEEQINFMVNNNYAFTFTAYEILKDKEEYEGRIFSVPNSINYYGYLKDTIIGNLTVILDQQLIGKVTVEDGPLEDVRTWMKYLNQGYLAYGLNKNLATYRVSKHSVSGNKIQNAYRYFRILRDTQNLSISKSLYFHSNYLKNAIIKRIK